MRRYLILFLFFVLGVLLFIWTLKDVGFGEVMRALSLLKCTELFLVFSAIFLSAVIIGSFRWEAIIGKKDRKTIKFYKIFLAKLVGYGISYITPIAFIGGEPASFYVLREETKLPSPKIIALIILDKLIFLLTTTIFFFAGLFFMLFYLNLSWLMEFVGFGLLCLMIAGFWMVLRKAGEASAKKQLFLSLAERFYLNKLDIIKKNKDKLGEIEQEIVSFFTGSKKRLFKVFGLNTIELILAIIACWLTAFFLGAHLSVPKILAIKSMMDLSYSFPLPAGLGTMEISQGFLFKMMSFNMSAGVAFSLIIRGMNLVISFLALLFFGGVQVKLMTRRLLGFIDKVAKFYSTKDKK